MEHNIGEKQRLLPTVGASAGGAALATSEENASSSRRSFLRGPLLPLLVVFGLFAVSMGAGRFTSVPHSSSGSPAPAGDAALAEHQRLEVDIPTSVDERTLQSRHCSTPSEPVLGGVDLVSYRDLEEGGAPSYGVPEHTVVYNGYTFLFSDETNKARFEVSGRLREGGEWVRCCSLDSR